MHALRALTAEKLRDHADESVDIAVGLGDTVLVMGLSTGGNVAAWMARHRADVTVQRYRFESALQLPHDLIDTSQRCGMPEVMYAVLIALMEKQTLPDVSMAHARCGVARDTVTRAPSPP